MPVEGIFSKTINLLGKSVDLRARNQNLISSNIANAETPGYIPKSLSFEDELQGAVKKESKGRQASTSTHPRHIQTGAKGSGINGVSGRVVETPSKTPGKDGNAVELEAEMSRMLENQLMYNASVQILAKKFEGLRSAIKGGV